ncbi:hypothetical protein [Fluviispira sanaruensis]|uniref:Uncharacterized protein n=1 Tax=Fluviispira sanaruensis TaxID=2493639 RepID=A0A4P2VL11_FLUSA|nr:hypothetical protein [Fluviispira sanaruensis]BBH54023.1 hypothetical protein JCM31447_24800 [Fluviispira sanaruensis]
MKKSFVTILLLLFTVKIYSLPINYIYGSFRTSQSMDKIYFLPTFNEKLSPEEVKYSDIWLKQIFTGTHFKYNDLTVSLDYHPSVQSVVRGCFWGWLKQLDLPNKLMLMEFLKPETPTSFLRDEIGYYADSLLKFSQINKENCRFEKPILDLSFTYIFIGLDQYLSEKASSRPEDEKYERILGKTYTAQSQDSSMNELKNFLAWIDAFQMYSPQASAEIVNEFVEVIEKSPKESWNESETAFLFIDVLRRKLPNFSDYINDYYKMIPYQKSAKLLHDKCFLNGKFLSDNCGIHSIYKNFVVFRLTRSTDFSDNLVWVGQ